MKKLFLDIESLPASEDKREVLKILYEKKRQKSTKDIKDFEQYYCDTSLDGAFGSDHEDRDRLLPVALEKFSRRGLSFSPGDCIVVGDTPLDVQCARIHGARCLAVATGPYTKEQLLNTDADIVFDTLEDIERCLEFINGV